MSDASPIFVRGLSRSGGTLLVTLLDAHPAIAMSYELYPTLLELDEGDSGRAPIEAVERTLRRAPLKKLAVNGMPTRGLRTFVARCERSGIGHREVAKLIGEHLAAGLDFDDVSGRLRLIERCALLKMNREGKRRWGLKCNNRYEEYLALWPDACFLNVLRDGRDVLASQLNTGSFRNSAREVAESWVQTHRRFLQLASTPGVNAHLVRYEQLTAEPAAEVERICAFLGLEHHPGMLDYHRRDLTIYQTSHLSMDRISKPIDSSQVGRWRSQLSAEQVADFHAVAGDFLQEMGYPV